VRFWHDLEIICRALRTKQRVVLGNLSAEVVDSMLYLTLPSGRRLAYPEARLEPGKFGKDEIVFKDNARGGWTDCRGWFGTFTENVVQAVARDLLAAAMLRLEAAGYPIVLHVHDEIVAEVPEGFGSPKEFLDLMTMLPDWATGLPVAAKVWMRKRYAKPAAITPLVPFVEPTPKISSHAIAGEAIGRCSPTPPARRPWRSRRACRHPVASRPTTARSLLPCASGRRRSRSPAHQQPTIWPIFAALTSMCCPTTSMRRCASIRGAHSGVALRRRA
jgi:hypothetical protein